MRWLVFCLAFVLAGCGSRPPYEGKSPAELERMLNDPDPTVQAQGAYGLGRLGPDARASVPALIDALKKESAVRQNAAAALSQIGPDASAAVPALTGLLRDPHWTVRRQAALALGNIGAAARPAAQALEKLRADPDTLVRKAADQALEKIGAKKTRGGR